MPTQMDMFCGHVLCVIMYWYSYMYILHVGLTKRVRVNIVTIHGLIFNFSSIELSDQSLVPYQYLPGNVQTSVTLGKLLAGQNFRPLLGTSPFVNL